MYLWLKEFKTFAMRGNVVDMAVGIIIGASFTNVVNSLVGDIIMPPIGVLLGGIDLSDFSFTLMEAVGEKEAVTLNYGQFLNNILDFTIVTIAVFLLIKMINQLQRRKKEKGPQEQDCPECLMKIPLGAKKCGHCSTALTPHR